MIAQEVWNVIDEEVTQMAQPGEGAEKVFRNFEAEHYNKENEFLTADKEIIIDGRILKENDRIYKLSNVIEETPENYRYDKILNDEIIKRISEVSEKIAREMFPRIAEKIIREEIEKLKRDAEDTEV